MQRRTRRGVACWRGRVGPQRKLPHTGGLRLALAMKSNGSNAKPMAPTCAEGGKRSMGQNNSRFVKKNARILFLIYKEPPWKHPPSVFYPILYEMHEERPPLCFLMVKKLTPPKRLVFHRITP